MEKVAVHISAYGTEYYPTQVGYDAEAENGSVV